MVTINVSDKLFYSLVVLGVCFLLSVGVYAYTDDGSGIASIMGHSADELDIAQIDFSGGLDWGVRGKLKSNQGASIELGGEGTPYIDFSDDATSDFDARMILKGDNNLYVEGSNLDVSQGGLFARDFVGTNGNVWTWGDIWVHGNIFKTDGNPYVACPVGYSSRWMELDDGIYSDVCSSDFIGRCLDEAYVLGGDDYDDVDDDDALKATALRSDGDGKYYLDYTGGTNAGTWHWNSIVFDYGDYKTVKGWSGNDGNTIFYVKITYDENGFTFARTYTGHSTRRCTIPLDKRLHGFYEIS